MKKLFVIALSVLVLFMISCEDQPTIVNETNEKDVAAKKAKLMQEAAIDHLGARPGFFFTFLSGFEQVPNPVVTDAFGLALFRFSHDGSQLHYKLFVLNIDSVLMAHIHLAPAGANGPVVLWLYPSSPPPQLIPGTVNGLLAEGTVPADSLMGPLAGMPLDSLKAQMMSGNTYVNVHTSPYPAGEIRGQISHPPLPPPGQLADYEITLENLTPATGTGSSQPFSPPVLTTHKPPLHLFKLHRFASPMLEKIAEDAANGPMLDFLNQSPRVFQVVEGTSPIPPGSSETFTIQAKRGFHKLSLVTMLVNTNDAFTGVDMLNLPRHGTKTFMLRSFDAGTELNTELAAHIPGPCCGNQFAGIQTHIPIRFHPGILGIGDLDPNVYDWDEPVAKLTVKRLTQLAVK